jgi:SAM-dependent methyltransferase
MMEQLKIILLALLFVIPSYSCLGQNPSETNRYTYKNGDPNGIGKWYLGREIAYVMGYQGISWLERPEREQEEKVSSLIKNMEIQSNDVIADIGAGSGYHVFKMAPLAYNGKIYAVDIQPQMLEAIRTNPLYNKNNNIETILGTEKSVNLPENSVDKILMVDVYHEFNFPYEMIMSMKKALKIDGKLFLIEYRGEDASIPIKKIHKMTESQAVKEMKAAGFNLESNNDNLPWQHCMVFIKKE